MTSLDLCLDSLDGLSVGDALGAQYFVPGNKPGLVPEGPWQWTDDTEMACSLVAELRDNERLDQDWLAAAFAERFEPYRGYGNGAVVLLHQIRDGASWRDAAPALFDGQGSMGNGAAMRVAPLGAFYAGDSRTAALEALRSAEVTHAHHEAILGAVAVAVAAAEAGWARLTENPPDPDTFLRGVIPYLVDSAVLRGVERARRTLGKSTREAAYELGNGSQVLAQDTVPFTLWVAATHLADYPSAVLACVEAGGDVDTTAAIVGGIVASYTGKAGIPAGTAKAGIPAAWLANREPLPHWLR